MHRHWQGQEETLLKEEQRAAHPANKGSSGGTCQESRGQCIKMDMCGVIYCCQHQNSLHQLTGVGQGLEKDSIHLIGPGYLRQLTAALSWFLLASARKGVRGSASAKRLPFSAQPSVFVNGTAMKNWRWVNNIHVLVPRLNLLTWHCLHGTLVHIASVPVYN